MKIFITGCSKSGTTLLQRLFEAFSDVVLVINEQSIENFCLMDHKDVILVGKRTQHEIYSFIWKGKEIFLKDITKIQKHKVILINIFRDGRDVIESENYRVSPKEWIDCIYQIINYPQYLTLNLRYEDIVSKPNEIQQVVSDKLGLKVEYKWNTYPSFSSKKVYDLKFYRYLEEYRLRPISTNRIGKCLQLYKSRCSSLLEKLEFERMLRLCGYIK